MARDGTNARKGVKIKEGADPAAWTLEFCLVIIANFEARSLLSGCASYFAFFYFLLSRIPVSITRNKRDYLLLVEKSSTAIENPKKERCCVKPRNSNIPIK